MTGDHKHYTNDFRLVIMVKTLDEWILRPHTEYENKVLAHYEWMRTVMWSETPQTNCDNVFIVNSQPPTYEEATAAAELLEAVSAGNSSSIVSRLPEEFRMEEFQDNCDDIMRNIITKYMEHQKM